MPSLQGVPKVRKLEPDFVQMLSDHLTWERCTGVDQYDERLFAVPVVIRCRIDNDLRNYLTTSDQQAVSSTVIHLDGAYGIGVRDRITLPNGDQPPILNVNLYSDDKGPLYEELST